MKTLRSLLQATEREGNICSLIIHLNTLENQSHFGRVLWCPGEGFSKEYKAMSEHQESHRFITEFVINSSGTCPCPRSPSPPKIIPRFHEHADSFFTGHFSVFLGKGKSEKPRTFLCYIFFLYCHQQLLKNSHCCL